MNEKKILKTENPSSYLWWIITAAVILILNISLLFTIQTQAQTFVHITDMHIAGDISVGGYDKNGTNFAKMVEHIKTLSPAPDFVIASGDLVNTATLHSINSGGVTIVPDHSCWEAMTKSLTKSGDAWYLAGTAIPVYFTPGNHDYRNFTHTIEPLSLIGYDAYIPRVPSGCTAGSNNPGNGAYRDYYFVNGNAVVISLNSGPDVTKSSDWIGDWSDPLSYLHPESTGLNDDQITFLNNTLAAHSTKQKIIFMHVPAVNPDGSDNFGTDYLGKNFEGHLTSVDDACILNKRTEFINACKNSHTSNAQVVVLQGHLHTNVVLDENGIKQDENWTGGPRYVQTAEGFNGALRIFEVKATSVTVSKPLLAFCGNNETVTVTPEMLHHDSPNAGKKIFDLYFSNGDYATFLLKGFDPGTELKIVAARCTYPSENMILEVEDMSVFYNNQEVTEVIADITATVNWLGSSLFVKVQPEEIGMKQAKIMFEDVSYNSKKSGGKDNYTYYKNEYIKKTNIKYTYMPDNVEKAPKTEANSRVFCKETENKGPTPKGTIPGGEVVMSKSADWFCGIGSGSCFLYAVDEVNYFRKGWTYDYSDSDYWNAGSGPVIATFIYNYGCKSNMNFTCKFYKPNGELYHTHNKNYHCNDPGYWGYVAPGIYIHDNLPEGRWKLEYWVGSSLKKTVEFDVYSASDADRFTFIDPTPADESIISGNLNNGQYNMTAAANGHVGGATKIRFYVDEEVHEEIQIHNSIGTSVWTVKNIPDGNHTIRAKINGTLGWLSTEKRTISTDNAPPAYCSITSPANNAATTSLSCPVTVNVPADAVKVEYYVDGTLEGSSDAAPFSRTVSLINDDDEATLIAVAYDAAGNKTASSGAVNINLRYVYISSPEAGADLPNDAVINIEAKTVGAAPSNVKFYVDGIYKFTDNSSPYIYPWPTPGSGHSGNYTLRAVADYAGYPDNQHEIDVIVGGDLGEWQYTSNLREYKMNGASTVIINGYIYVLGGLTGSGPAVTKNIDRAKINPDGSLEAWELCGQLVKARADACAVHIENYIYIIGGGDFHSNYNTVERIPVYANGDIGASEILSNTLNGFRIMHAGVKAGNYIYVIGGSGPYSTTSSVEFAHIEEDGTLGEWTVLSSKLNVRKFGNAAVAVKGYIYTFGGQAATNSSSTKHVERAKINDDGTLTNWAILPDLPNAVSYSASVVNNNFIYNIGGINWGHNSGTKEVIRAYVYEDGSLSEWKQVASLNKDKYYHSAAVNSELNNAIYTVGGISDRSVEYILCTNGPTISNVSSSDISPNSAKITWSTNIPADSRVDYWTDGSWPNFFSTPITNTSPPVTSHSVTITDNLAPNTLYYYRVVSTNDNGNTSMAGTYNFTTLPPEPDGFGRLAKWPMNEGFGPIIPDMINNNDGTISGATWTDGKVGNGLSFDGVNDYVDFNNILDVFVTNTFSIEAWVNVANYTDNSNRTGMIIQKWHTSDLNDNAFILYCNGSFVTNNKSTDFTTPPLNTWTHIAVSMNNGDVSIYVNGELDATDTGHDCNATNFDLRIGNLWNNCYNFDGKIDEATIYNRALTADEISEHFKAGTFVAKYTMDNIAGTTLFDETLNDNDGTIKGATVVPGIVGNALIFDGSSTVNIPDANSLDMTDAITVEAWILLNEYPSNYQDFLNKEEHSTANGGTQNGFILRSNSNGRPYFFVGNKRNGVGPAKTLHATVAIPLHTFTHVVGTYDGSSMKIYIDGNLNNTTPYTGGIGTNSKILTLAGLRGIPHGKCIMDEVAVYDRALTADEISEHYSTSTLAAKYTMDDIIGTTLYDETLNNNDGTVNGATVVAGKIGNALSFDGSNDYVDFNDTLDVFVTNTFSIEAWVNVASYTDNSNRTGMIIQKWHTSDLNDNAFILYCNGHFYSNNKTTDFTAPPLNTWTHIAVSMNNGDVSIYVNGELDAADTGHDCNATSFDLRIGNLWNNCYNFDGKIDEVAIYNRALTAEEIAEHAGVESNVVVQLHMDEESGNIAYDATTNNNDGTISGATQTTDCAAGSHALSFDGSNDYVDCGNDASLNITKNLTIEAWIKPNSLSGSGGIVSKLTGTSNKQYSLNRNGDKIQLQYEQSSNNYAVSGGTLTNNTWQHVAVTIDDALNIVMYIDGNSVVTDVAPAETSASTEPVIIGKWAGTYNSLFFDGRIDEPAIYNRVLTAAEIAEHATQSSNGSIAGTVTDAGTSNPIQGATVTAGTRSDNTDASGNYSIANVPANSYTVTASKSGYVTKTTNNVNVTAGNTTTVDFSLTETGTSEYIKLDDYTISSYHDQDNDPSNYQFQDGGYTIRMWGNNWKAIDCGSQITASSVLEFDFKSTGSEGEINGICIDDDLYKSQDRTFKVYGTQNWGITNYDNYSGSDWKHYSIPIGSHYTGNFNYIVFLNDADGGQATNVFFRNFEFTGGKSNTGGITSIADESGADIIIYPNPSNGIFNIKLSGTFNLEVIDITGKLVKKQVLNNNINSVSISGTGIFILKFTNDKTSVIHRIIISE